MLIIGGDPIEHVERGSQNYDEGYGGWGYGDRNSEEERSFEIYLAHDQVVANTRFQKCNKYLIIYQIMGGIFGGK